MTSAVSLLSLRQGTVGPQRSRPRKEPHLTQAEVAALVGIDRSLYNNLENGNREFTPHYAELLEPVLGIEVWALVETPSRRVNQTEREQLSYLDRLRLLEARDAHREEELRTFAESTTGRLVALEAGRANRAPRGSRKAPDEKRSR